MLFSDTYKMPLSNGEGLYKDKGSKFLAFSFPVLNEGEAKLFIEHIKKEHFSAAHHCYAYVLGFTQAIQKSNDDREPNNTAGKPILRAILSNQLTNTLVIVVRYFGGKLLGVSGLIQAYGESAKDAIQHTVIIDKIITERHKLIVAFEFENEAFKIIKQYGLKIIDNLYAEEITIIFEVRKMKAAEVINAIQKTRMFQSIFLSEQ